MKQYEHQHVTGMVTGGLVALFATLMSYWLAQAIQGQGVTTVLLLLSGTGMLVGAGLSFLVSQAEEGAHFVLKQETEGAGEGELPEGDVPEQGAEPEQTQE